MMMKSIEDAARDYQRSDESDGTTATAFEHGAEWMRRELTRWHDPKEEAPEFLKDVLLRFAIEAVNGFSTLSDT